MRQELTRRVVWMVSVIIVFCCVIWGVAVQYVVPDACTYDEPPPNAQYLHCP